MSKHLRKLSLAAMLGTATMASGQGVPIVDANQLQKNLQILSQQLADLKRQKGKQEQRAEIARLHEEQLAALDAIIGSTRPTGSSDDMIAELEAGDEPASAAANLYAPEDANTASPELFGDAQVTVEQVIIRAAQATYSHPGVAKAGLSPVQWRALLQALIWQESRFNPHAESPAGAYGLTQIMSGTAGDLGIKNTYRNDPYVQAEGGARYLAQQLNTFNGDVVLALAAYNAGPGNVQKHNGVPPFSETQHYVQIIPTKYNEYLAKTGGVEALGTIDPVLAAGAHTAMMSDGAMIYGDNAYEMVRQSAVRVRSIIERIGTTETPHEAMALNAYMRAETARVMVLLTRLRAANSKPLSAEAIQLAVEQAAERRFLKFGD